MESTLESMAIFDKQLTSVPAELLDFRFQASAFGSWYLVLKKSGKQFRVVYEGRDGRYYFQSLVSGDDWSDIWSGDKNSQWHSEVLSRLKSVTK
jgi:hypothetical protein